jgi:hypothetical protein
MSKAVKIHLDFSAFQFYMLKAENSKLLVGESALPDVVEDIRRLANKHDKIEHVNEILTLHMGPEYILVNLSVDFKNSISAATVEQTVQQLDREIKGAHPLVKRVFIEGEARILPITTRVNFRIPPVANVESDGRKKDRFCGLITLNPAIRWLETSFLFPRRIPITAGD